MLRIHLLVSAELAQNDTKAKRQINRVLKPGGKAMIMIHVVGEKTLEDNSIDIEEKRKKYYGQTDELDKKSHVYSRLIIEKIREDIYLNVKPVLNSL